MKNCCNIIKIAFVFCGALFGAGFAGGRELVTFFLRFGTKGFYAGITASFLFIFFAYYVIRISLKYKITTYRDFLNCLFPSVAALLLNAVTEIFLLVCFSIMFSASSALFAQVFSLPAYIGAFSTAFLCYFALICTSDGISKIFAAVTPFMIVLILCVNIRAYFEAMPCAAINNTTSQNYILSALLYVSYNMLTITPVLIEISPIAKNKKTTLGGTFLGGFFIMLILFICLSVLSLHSEDIIASELPLLYVSKTLGNIYYFIYTVALYIAVLTTAFAVGTPLVTRISKKTSSRKISVAILIVLALPLSCIKLSSLISSCYTFFGYIGIIQLVGIVYNIFSKNLNQELSKEKTSIHDLF